MLKKIVDKETPGTKKPWVKSIPFMVCAADLEEGEARMSDARMAIAPINKALEMASRQVLMIHVCDLVEGAQSLETVGVNVDMESDDEGGSYPSLSVSCIYASGEDGDEDGNNIEDEMQDWLSDVSRDLYGEPITDRSLSPQNFLKQLSQVLMGESEGPEWLAAREGDALAKVAQKVSKTKARSMSL